MYSSSIARSTPTLWFNSLKNPKSSPFKDFDFKTYLLIPPLSSPQPKELLLLPGDKINPGIFQQCSKYKEQTHGHPDIDGFHVRNLRETTDLTFVRSSKVTTTSDSTGIWFDYRNIYWFLFAVNLNPTPIRSIQWGWFLPSSLCCSLYQSTVTSARL